MPNPTVISLFAGCGGSSAGYKMAGYDCRLAVERDKDTADCYRQSFPFTPIWDDVCTFTVDNALKHSRLNRGELTVLDGSPPCQGFSGLGKRDIDDPRNQLFKEFVRLLGGLLPKAFVMENVPGMIRGKMRGLYLEALKELRGCGYKVSAWILNAADYGVPQDRSRVIFIGTRNDINVSPSAPPPTHKDTRISVAIALNENYAMRNAFSKSWSLNKWRSPNLPAPTLVKSASPEMRICLPRDPLEPLFARDAITRRATIEECRILQGFPDWLIASKYGMIGNSVPPLLTKAIGAHILNILRDQCHQ